MENKNTNQLILEYCKKYGFVCYICPKCGRYTMGKSTVYHEQIHGDSNVLYNPLPQLVTK